MINLDFNMQYTNPEITKFDGIAKDVQEYQKELATQEMFKGFILYYENKTVLLKAEDSLEIINSTINDLKNEHQPEFDELIVILEAKEKHYQRK